MVCQSPKLRLVRPFPRSGAFSTRMSPMGVPFSSDSLTESEIGVQPTADMRAVVVVETQDGQWGILFGNNTWNGMIGMVKNKVGSS